MLMDGVNRKVGTVSYLESNGFSVEEIRALSSVASYLNERAFKDRPTSIHEIIKVLEKPENARAREKEILGACGGIEHGIMNGMSPKIRKLAEKEEREREELEGKLLKEGIIDSTRATKTRK
ncbi:MAG: hypothetical protein AB1468_06280, partial [Candidatus Micrarchaeota archaeon]